MRRIQSEKQEETLLVQESVSVRRPWPRLRSAPRRDSGEGTKYRLAWRRGPRRAQHDRTWGHLRRGARVIREVATRDWSVTSDACGVATLFVEVSGERTYLWRNWQAGNYPFVCALLEELGKPNPVLSAEPPPAPRQSSKYLHAAKRATRRERSERRERRAP